MNESKHPIVKPDTATILYFLEKQRNGEANEGVKSLLFLIQKTPGKRVPYFAQPMDTSVKNIERWLKRLKDEEKIEFRGAPNTGGYFAKFDNN